MEFKDVVRFIIRHYRILILGLILGGVLGLLYTISSPAPYEAISKILISRNKSDKESDFGYLTDQQLIQTYAYILKTQPIIDLVNHQINGNVDPDNVRVSQVVDTLILQIAVRDQNPQKAAYIANAFAKAMVIRSNQLQEEQYKLEEEGLTSQINSIRTQIDDLQAQYDNREITVNQAIIDDVDKQILAYRNEILTLQKEISLIKTPTNLDQESYIIERNTRLDEIQPLLVMYQEIRMNLEYLGRPYQSGSAPEDTTLSRLKTTIDQYQEVNLTLLNSLEKIRLEEVQSEPTVQTIEEAIVPTDRISLVFVMNPVISAGVGLILAMLLGLLRDRKGMKIATQQQLLKNLGLEVIGAIPPMPALRGGAGISPKVTAEDEEMIPFHSLRAFLEFHRIRTPYKSLLVTSFAIGDGKSTVASALAVNYALGGDDVVLVDANFVSADQYTRFKTKNLTGLSDILYRNQEFDKRSLKQTPFENLKLLTSGAHAPISMQLIDPQKMTVILGAAVSGKKLVIVDGPPLSDLNAMLLASAVDKILLVIRTGIYALDGLEASLNELGVDRKKILGVVLNEPICGIVENQPLETEITTGESEESDSSLRFMGGTGLVSQPPEKELVQTDSPVINDINPELNEAAVIPAQPKGVDEPGVIDQSEFVVDSSQERIFSRLFHFPGLGAKRQEKQEEELLEETFQGETHDKQAERVDPFLTVDSPKQSAEEDCFVDQDASTIMRDSNETKSILSWLKFWDKPGDKAETDFKEPLVETTELIAHEEDNRHPIDEIPDSANERAQPSLFEIRNTNNEQEDTDDTKPVSEIIDSQKETAELVDRVPTSLADKVKHSLEPIWNQWLRVLLPKNGLKLESEVIEQNITMIEGEQGNPIAADAAPDFQQESDVVQEHPIRTKPKGSKRVQVAADSQQAIPASTDLGKEVQEIEKMEISFEPLNEPVIPSKTSGKGRPKKVREIGIESNVPEKRAAKTKSSPHRKTGKAQLSDTAEKNEKALDSQFD